jgi:hypothetical protein
MRLLYSRCLRIEGHPSSHRMFKHNKYNIIKDMFSWESTNNRCSVPFISTSGQYLTDIEFFRSSSSVTWILSYGSEHTTDSCWKLIPFNTEFCHLQWFSNDRNGSQSIRPFLLGFNGAVSSWNTLLACRLGLE